MFNGNPYVMIYCLKVVIHLQTKKSVVVTKSMIRLNFMRKSSVVKLLVIVSIDFKPCQST